MNYTITLAAYAAWQAVSYTGVSYEAWLEIMKQRGYFWGA